MACRAPGNHQANSDQQNATQHLVQAVIIIMNLLDFFPAVWIVIVRHVIPPSTGNDSTFLMNVISPVA
jgi:hypothetical protein